MYRVKNLFDPRHFQILALSSFLLLAFIWFRLDINIKSCLAVIIMALGTQLLFCRLYRVPVWDVRSPLISSLSLCLLFRAESIIIPMLAAFLSIASKFLLRINGKHVFNPTNFGITVMLLLHAGWVSPGQWGGLAWFSMLAAIFGLLVVTKAARYDTAFFFIAAYATIIIGRGLWLGDPATIMIHQLKSTSLLIFTFFMITDPMTTPDSRAGRALFAAITATFALYLKFSFYWHDALFYALFICSMAVPMIDKLLPGVKEKYSWAKPA